MALERANHIRIHFQHSNFNDIWIIFFQVFCMRSVYVAGTFVTCALWRIRQLQFATRIMSWKHQVGIQFLFGTNQSISALPNLFHCIDRKITPNFVYETRHNTIELWLVHSIIIESIFYCIILINKPKWIVHMLVEIAAHFTSIVHYSI